MIVDVGLFYFENRQPVDRGIWYAEWAPRGSSEATDDLATDLALLVAGIVEDVRLMGGVSLVWHFEPGGLWASPAETRQLVEQVGVTLPHSVLEDSRQDRTGSQPAPTYGGRLKTRIDPQSGVRRAARRRDAANARRARGDRIGSMILCAPSLAIVGVLGGVKEGDSSNHDCGRVGR